MIIIGEKINASIPKTKQAVLGHDDKYILDLALKQEAAGATIIDINVGTGEGSSQDEAAHMARLASMLAKEIKGLLCIDSADPLVLEAGLEAAGEKAGLLNSVKATDESLKSVLPLASKFKVPVIGLVMDKDGIPRDPAGRLAAAEKILNAAAGLGIPPGDVYIDPIVLPVSTDNSQGKVTLDTLLAVKASFPEAKAVLAASNVSYGLPERTIVNQAMIQMAMLLMVDALIINPLDEGLMTAIKAANVVLGMDRHCRKYSRAIRNRSSMEKEG